ncbi:uncharacterized protein C8A04DRAFT_34808 [Dichotomopilus funicola]|uniref:Uncharacterized protein n=1 Tax=Dichotomopilus funicola TaxID=1934379 RepID=A0AAN6V8V6_9PEZI|nr:hypothetical protein C8A04DRAFT_34808 [Dichotomopilus funicola]
MAHLPPNMAIFSPSVARAAASAAKEWSYVDSWLQAKFPTGDPPQFERNPDTLRALLSIASANEAADEEQTLLARLEAETLDQLRAHEDSRDRGEGHGITNNTLESAREAILTALETALPREGQTALTALAALALQTNTPLPTPAVLGAELLDLSTAAAELEQTTARIHTLTSHIAREAAATADLTAELRPPSPNHHHHHHSDDDDDDDLSQDDEPHQGPTSNPNHPRRSTKIVGRPGSYQPPADLALQNLALQRRIKALTTRIPELRDRAAAASRYFSSTYPSHPSSSSPTKPTHSHSHSPSKSSITSTSTFPFPSLTQLQTSESAHRALASEKRALEDQVRAFQGLPPDTEQARQEVESMRGRLRRMTLQRDEAFEELVERETPRRGREREREWGR